MTACSSAVSAHACWNWAVRAGRTAIPLFILGHTLSTCRNLDMKRPGSIRRACWGFCVTIGCADTEAQGNEFASKVEGHRQELLLSVIAQGTHTRRLAGQFLQPLFQWHYGLANRRSV